MKPWIGSNLHPLCNDHTLEERTTISVSDVRHLTKLCMTSTYFQYQDEFFKWVEGAAMGSLLFPVAANLYLESFEQSALKIFPLTSKASMDPPCWRYFRAVAPQQRSPGQIPATS